MNRHCCDGLCSQGRDCPAFAPGVIVRFARNQQRRMLRRWFTRGVVVLVLLIGARLLGAWS